MAERHRIEFAKFRIITGGGNDGLSTIVPLVRGAYFNRSDLNFNSTVQRFNERV